MSKYILNHRIFTTSSVLVIVFILFLVGSNFNSPVYADIPYPSCPFGPLIAGEITAKWQSVGGLGCAIFPAPAVIFSPFSSKVHSELPFARGTMVWEGTYPTNILVIPPDILKEWTRIGGEDSLGKPLTDASDDGKGNKYVNFDNGLICWNPDNFQVQDFVGGHGPEDCTSQDLRTFEIPANAGWYPSGQTYDHMFNTNYNLDPEKPILIRATGVINFDTNDAGHLATPTSQVRPDGTWIIPEGCPGCSAPGQPLAGLIASDTNSQWIFVGDKLIFRGTGTLKFGINDDDYSNNSGSYLVTIRELPQITAPSQAMYKVHLDQFIIANTRAAHDDTDIATFNLMGENNEELKHQESVGLLNNGNHWLGWNPFPAIPVGQSNPYLRFSYLIMNTHNGGQDLDKIADAGSAILTAAGWTTGAGWLTALSKVAEWALPGLFVSGACDGAVAADQIIFTSDELATLTQPTGSYHEIRFYPGTDSSHGCGSNSGYFVMWTIERVSGSVPQGKPNPATVNLNPHSGFLIQSNFGNKGNFELVTPLIDGGFAHLWRDNDDNALPWSQGSRVAGGTHIDSISLIQSNFGGGNLEAVARSGDKLASFWYEPGKDWHESGLLPGSGFSGNPALIQSHFGSKGNFELVVPSIGGGLAYLYRDNDKTNLPWNGPSIFGTSIGKVDSVSLIESNFGNPGNLELVARTGDKLVEFWKETGKDWQGPVSIPGNGYTGVPSIIQSNFGTKGNFELVVPRSEGGIASFWRNNDQSDLPWNTASVFGQDYSNFTALSMIQSNFGSKGNFELVGKTYDNKLITFWRDNDKNPPSDWINGGMINLNIGSSIPSGGIPSGGIPSGGIPSGGIPSGGIPSGGIPSGGIPSGGIPSGGIPSGGIPSGGIPSNSGLIKIIPDHQSYHSGDMVSIKFESGLGAAKNIAVQIVGPNNFAGPARSIITDASGGSFLQFRSSNDFPEGTYQISATASNNGMTAKGSASFSVSNQQSSVRIISVQATDEHGNPVSSYVKGQLGSVKIVVSSSSNVNALVSANLFGSDSTSLGIGSVRSTINGNSESIFSFSIPNDSKGGTANIYADVFSEWPSQGGVSLSPESQTTVEIK